MTTDQLQQILTFATRAPSTHNSQPWLFRLGQDQVDVFYDKNYVLPQADQEGRDLHISIGCMLENLSIASDHFGFEAKISYGPFAEETQKAHVTFVPTQTKGTLTESLFATIPTRVNARGVFTNDTVSKDVEQVISTFPENDIAINIIDSKEIITGMAGLTQEAMHLAYESKPFRSEMSHWMNSNISNKKEGLPGYALKMPLIVSLIIPFLIRYVNMGKVLGKKNFETISSAPLMIVFSGPNDPIHLMQVGRLAERTMLYVQSNGYQSSIYVGSIEIGDLHTRVQKLVGTKDRPQFIFTVGHIPGEHKITPRHPLAKKIIA